ncbi:MAG: pectate lyase [Planctomycetaceae bacterium]
MPVENSTSFCLSVGNSAILFVMLVWTVADVIAQDTSGSALQLRLLDDDEVDSVEHALGNTYEPIDFSLFRDSIHHWQMKDGRDRNDARYQPEQVVHIAENLLKFQNEDGGWPANLDWLAIIDVQEIRRLRNNTLGRSTFDNRNIYPQIEYLAKVAQVTGLSRYRQAATRGLEYILQEQRATGGWRGRDVDAITFNDDVMVGIMHLLLDIRQNPPHFDWLEPDFKTRLSQALGQAIEVTLMCQIQVDGRKTAWCQQHDHVTFQPVKARTYELPSITALESARRRSLSHGTPQPDSGGHRSHRECHRMVRVSEDRRDTHRNRPHHAGPVRGVHGEDRSQGSRRPASPTHLGEVLRHRDQSPLLL